MKNLLSQLIVAISYLIGFVVAFAKEFVFRVKRIDHSGFKRAVSDRAVLSINGAKAWFFSWVSWLQRSPTVYL